MRNGNGVLSIPASSKKMVQSLKEIVNCPEHEIYAMLKECDMDPNDTVNRLLSQGVFFLLLIFGFAVLVDFMNWGVVFLSF